MKKTYRRKVLKHHQTKERVFELIVDNKKKGNVQLSEQAGYAKDSSEHGQV